MEMSNKDKAALTYKGLQRRKAERKRGIQDATIHIYENVQKIRIENNRRKKGRC